MQGISMRYDRHRKEKIHSRGVSGAPSRPRHGIGGSPWGRRSGPYGHARDGSQAGTEVFQAQGRLAHSEARRCLERQNDASSRLVSGAIPAITSRIQAASIAAAYWFRLRASAAAFLSAVSLVYPVPGPSEDISFPPDDLSKGFFQITENLIDKFVRPVSNKNL